MGKKKAKPIKYGVRVTYTNGSIKTVTAEAIENGLALDPMLYMTDLHRNDIYSIEIVEV